MISEWPGDDESGAHAVHGENALEKVTTRSEGTTPSDETPPVRSCAPCRPQSLDGQAKVIGKDRSSQQHEGGMVVERGAEALDRRCEGERVSAPMVACLPGTTNSVIAAMLKRRCTAALLADFDDRSDGRVSRQPHIHLRSWPGCPTLVGVQISTAQAWDEIFRCGPLVQVNCEMSLDIQSAAPWPAH